MSLNPRYNYQNRQSPKIDGYEVRNTVTAVSEDLENVGPMLDALVKAGVNNINGVKFSISEPDAAKNEARSKAIKSAKAKAQSMATAAGVKLGNLTSISETRAASLESAPTPIAAGEQNLSVTVNLTYEIVN